MSESVERLEKQVTLVARLDYLLYTPPDYGAQPQRSWPLMLFLHGAGERGSDIAKVRVHGIPKMTASQALPFVAVSPQCPEGTTWSALTYALLALLDEIESRYAIDGRRVYLTGLSMGGFGTWQLAAEYPERFAAIAPICGGGSWFYGFPERVCALRNVPVWAFHGAQDSVVPLRESKVLVEQLKACGGDVRFTVYPEAGHDAWTETYANPDLYTWFLQHTRE